MTKAKREDVLAAKAAGCVVEHPTISDDDARNYAVELIDQCNEWGLNTSDALRVLDTALVRLILFTLIGVEGNDAALAYNRRTSIERLQQSINIVSKFDPADPEPSIGGH